MDYSYILPVEFQSGWVVFSIVVAFLGTYTGLTAAAQIRGSTGEPPRVQPLCTAALALGGVGVWGMHFIGMRAQILPFLLDYDTGATLVSLAVAVGFCGFAMWYAASGKPTLGRSVLSGCLAGLGVVTMHYTGMVGTNMPILGVEWHRETVILSVVLAVVAATATMWLTFRIATLWARALGALLMTVGITGMHYTATLAAGLVCYTDQRIVAEPSMSVVSFLAALLMAVVATLIMLSAFYSGGRKVNA